MIPHASGRAVLSVVLVLAGALVAPAASAAVFGLLDTSELYSSSNGGASWTVLSTLPASDAVGLAAGSSASDLYLVTRSGSIYRSSNGGSGWDGVGAVAASDVASFTLGYDASVLVLTESGMLYRSIDGGATFLGLAALSGSGFVSLCRGPSGRLFALTGTGEVYESQNQGSVWSAVGRVTISNAVSIRRWGAVLYMLAKTGEVFRSFDMGRAWVAVGSITASNMKAILEDGSTLLAAAETGEIYASTNGSSWAPVGAINQASLVSLAADTPLATGVDVETVAPAFAVRAPYPNPTTRGAGSTFVLMAHGGERVRLELYDVRGRCVAKLSPQVAGSVGAHSVTWKPDGVPNGVYLVRAISESGRSSTVKWSIVE